MMSSQHRLYELTENIKLFKNKIVMLSVITKKKKNSKNNKNIKVSNGKKMQQHYG